MDRDTTEITEYLVNDQSWNDGFIAGVQSEKKWAEFKRNSNFFQQKENENDQI